MKLTVLVDVVSGEKCEAEHGLSFLIEADEKVLLDTGQTDLFLHNAKILGVNLDEVEFIVLSHGHWDHSNGLKFLEKKKLVCHPDCFLEQYRKRDDCYNGPPFSFEEAKKKFEVILTKKPFPISKEMTFLGEIPRKNDFEAKKTGFYKAGGEDNFILDDSALAVKTDKGLVVVSGCSHAGICNTVEYAKEVTGLKKVYAVIGGFHLPEIDDVTLKTIEYFKENQIERVHSSHCTALPVLSRFQEEFGSSRLRAGDILEF